MHLKQSNSMTLECPTWNQMTASATLLDKGQCVVVPSSTPSPLPSPVPIDPAFCGGYMTVSESESGDIDLGTLQILSTEYLVDGEENLLIAN
jgi:hypothetical protein